MRKLTLFSFGYWGWGNSTPQLIEAVDAVERSRGFKPPIFADIRIQRSVRAPGFHGNAFEAEVGEKRYHWIKDLGNKFIQNRTGRRIQIARPAAVQDLLELAIEAAHDRRRLIFFCSCPTPRNDGQVGCHRTTVTSLALRAAKRRGLDVEFVEWPGGEPRCLELTVPMDVFRAVASGKSAFPIGRMSLAEVASIPWGSVATLSNHESSIHRLVGPAIWSRDAWQLPVIWQFFDPNTALDKYLSRAESLRRDSGWVARRS